MSTITAAPPARRLDGGRSMSVSASHPGPVRVEEAPAASTPPPVRLTTRGRVVVTVVLLALVLAGFVLAGARSAATPDPGSPAPTETVVVSRGDTLWGIASEVGAPEDIRVTIHRIKELNALSGVALVEGQELAVPVVDPGSARR